MAGIAYTSRYRCVGLRCFPPNERREHLDRCRTNHSMKVSATRLIRKMRGGAQAHLIECSDGHCYVVKFQNNPQHPRMLVNEWIASSLLTSLRISTPEIALVNLSAEFLAESPNVYIQLHNRHLAVEPGLHFGSRLVGNASKTAVYDFIPDRLLEKVVNRNEFLGALVLDKWTGNADMRQAVFCRRRTVSMDGGKRPGGFSASMIDQGCAFGGPHWRFFDSPLQGLYFRAAIYRGVRCWDDFGPWLDQVVRFPEEALYGARQQVPPEWIFGEESSLDTLLDRLLARRNRVPDLIADSVRAQENPFPNWGVRDASR